MRIRYSLFVIGLIVGLGITACEHADPLTDMPPPEEEPEATLSRIQTTIFDLSCAISGCHVGASAPRGLDLSAGQAHDNLVGISSREKPDLVRVDPGNPDESYLVHKIEGRADIVGQPMPLGRSMLSTDEIQLIRDWIADGAEDN